jgi:FAD-dependent urate hydroxylase
MNATDVAIVGSGPYALSLAAHLRARGVAFRVFGPPMKFWRDMPRGIHLKSLAHATNVYVPAPGLGFSDWCRSRGLEDYEPCTMESFAAYGVAVQRSFVPELDPVEVSMVKLLRSGSFEIALETEERLEARRVVLATGLSHFAHTPATLRALPRDLVSHTSEHVDYARFRGRTVAVVGAGASAIEAGALVHEAGGRAEILVRGPHAVFHARTARRRPLWDRIRRPGSVLGFGLKSRVLELAPLAFHFAPEGPRLRFVRKHLGPAAPWWIQPRVEGHVPIRVQTHVLGAERAGDRVRLRLGGAGAGADCLEVDHVIAGTGYVADVDRLAYLDADFRRRLTRVERAPVLSMHFESSVPGAYFVGPVAAPCFGPLFRFVAGAGYAAPALARHLARRARDAREQSVAGTHAVGMTCARVSEPRSELLAPELAWQQSRGRDLTRKRAAPTTPAAIDREDSDL